MDGAGQDKTAIIAITRAGADTARRLQKAMRDGVLYLPEKLILKQGGESSGFDETLRFAQSDKYTWHTEQGGESTGFACAYPIKKLLKQVFNEYKKIILFVSVGAAVRLLSPLVKSKLEDPAVVVVDQDGRFAISLLSGHIGGANDLAREAASALGGVPVITTASELSGTVSADMIGSEFGWRVENKENLKSVSAALINGEKTGVYQDSGERDWLPEGKKAANLFYFDSLEALLESDCKAAIIITDKIIDARKRSLLKKSVVYRPRSLVIGIGCRRGAGSEELEQAMTHLLEERKLALKSVRKLATIDIKKDEEGISHVARKYSWPVEYYSREELNKYCRDTASCSRSKMVLRRIGTPAVCEPAALMSSGSKELLADKTVKGNVTVALARVDFCSSSERAQRAVPFQDIGTKGKLYLVGLGPGNQEQMTERARKALQDSQIILGYRTYLRQIDSFLEGKEVIASGMGDEIVRAQKAISLAKKGRKVALVSGGDAGIYGMAGLVFELLQKEGKKANDSFGCEVVPGVPALNAAASLLGAPIMCDFAAINLSDLLVPWESIAQRLESAARGDFVIALYNPASHKRKEQIARAAEILLKYRNGATPAGIVTDAFRKGQEVVLTDLEHMLEHKIGMNTLVIIGNSSTFRTGDWMVTPRGYGNKYQITKSKGQIKLKIRNPKE